MNNIFENAYFGKPYKTRNGETAIYLSTEYHDTFTIVHAAIEHHIRYADGSENRFHEVNMYGIGGNFNRFDTETEYPYDIVSEWQEEKEK